MCISPVCTAMSQRALPRPFTRSQSLVADYDMIAAIVFHIKVAPLQQRLPNGEKISRADGIRVGIDMDRPPASLRMQIGTEAVTIDCVSERLMIRHSDGHYARHLTQALRHLRKLQLFDSIPHTELMKLVARRVVDGAMLQLIKMWLEAPVEDTDERGNTHRSTRNRDEGRGTPQGSPISPLLSNLYMRRFVLGWKKLGHEKRWKAYIVNYADDLVICCRTGAEPALAEMRMMMSKLKLTVNEKKTRVCYLPEEKFDFLGYSVLQKHTDKEFIMN
jgi:hypothetical protein